MKISTKFKEEENSAQTENNTKPVSHVKSKEPPAPPEWNIEIAMGLLEESLNKAASNYSDHGHKSNKVKSKLISVQKLPKERILDFAA